MNENYQNYAWKGTSHDGYADTLESGINLYNRELTRNLKRRIDSEMQECLPCSRNTELLAAGTVM